MSNNQTKDKLWQSPWMLVLLFFTIFLVWHGYWWWADHVQMWRLIGKENNLSNLGDWFNALSALFAGWAFVALIYTIILQRTELRQTREEFRLQREELTIQSATFSQQTFENTFFQMLTSLREIAHSARYDNYSGNAAFQEIYGRFTRVAEVTQPPFDRYKLFVSSCFDSNADTLAPFFRMLYMIFRLIHDNHSINKQKQKFYANVVRAQLTKHQLILLFFYCQSIEDGHIKTYDGEKRADNHPDITNYVREYNTLKYLTKADSKLIEEGKLNSFKK